MRPLRAQLDIGNHLLLNCSIIHSTSSQLQTKMPSFMCMPFLACNRQVDSLDRRQCNLQSIPGDIERYARSLEELLLDMNHIHDLPKSLFRLQKLQRLGLSDNDIHRLPSEVAALQNLMELNLSRNDISDLPEDLKICHNLQVLDISSNPIARLPDSITLCTSLTQLALNDISLTKLPHDLGRLAALKTLEARENHLRALPPSVAELSQLQRLDLGQNELDELPAEVGALRALVELYVDENSLERLPDAMLRCTRLEQLDASSNKLFQLPDELGELVALVDITVSHNCLRELPSSLGRLKQLMILKADDNTIDILTPAIGGCTGLTELYLQQNLIAELPSSIGNLKALQTLNLDRCQLRRLPALLGECASLTVLSVRDNQLHELPMEVGKLARLRVMDVCNNRLAHLPYTINVLQDLQALWLSENQSQALLRLQQDIDPRSGIKVLTCYLLPQRDASVAAASNDGVPSGTNLVANQQSKAAFVGGPKVHFGGDGEEGANDGTTAAEDGAEMGATFEFKRKNTPHPKNTTSGQGTKLKQYQQQQHKHKGDKVDGHVAPRVEEHPPSIVLSGKKVSHDHSSSLLAPAEQQPSTSGSTADQLRSALKYSSRAIQQQQQQHQTEAAHPPPTAQQRYPPSGSTSQPKTVLFTGAKPAPQTNQAECKLKRVNTPHYKSTRGTTGDGSSGSGSTRTSAPAVTAAQNQFQPAGGISSRRQLPQASSSLPAAAATVAQDGMHVQMEHHQRMQQHHNPSNNNNTDAVKVQLLAATALNAVERMRVNVRRAGADGDGGGGGGLGLSIAGGIESTPFVEDDPGLFISKLAPGGAAERAGICVGDKVLDINGTPMVGQRHHVAVQCIQQSSDVVELLLERRRTTTEHPPFSSSSSAFTAPAPPLAVSSASSSSLHQTVRFSPPAPQHHRPQLGLSSSASANIASHHASASSTTTSPSMTTTTIHHPNTLFPSALTTPAVLQQQQLPSVSEHPFGDPQLDDIVEEVELVRDSRNSLGLSIVGGIDHCSHPFGTPALPGVFISRIAPNSSAHVTRRLRVGDRILKVCSRDISGARHNDAVEALKNTGRTLSITVRHERQPTGLRVVVVPRRDTQPLGLSICGGIGSAPMNPQDRTDEGIFIERVEHDGPAEQCVGNGKPLTVGTRILEVNDESLLGCAKEEAAHIFRTTQPGPRPHRPYRLGRPPQCCCHPETFVQSRNSSCLLRQMPMLTQHIHLLQITTVTKPATTHSSAIDNEKMEQQQHQKKNNKKEQIGNEYQNLSAGHNGRYAVGLIPKNDAKTLVGREMSASVALLDIGTMEEQQQKKMEVTTFSSEPYHNNQQLNKNNNSICEQQQKKVAAPPPPVAPKPKTNFKSFAVTGGSKQQQHNVHGEGTDEKSNGTAPEASADFSSRLRLFQHEPSQNQTSSATLLPWAAPSMKLKRPLLSSDDLAKLAEDDRMRTKAALQPPVENGRRAGSDDTGEEPSQQIGMMLSPMSPFVDGGAFEHILNDSPVPFVPSSIGSIRTKKAENRFLQTNAALVLSSSPSPTISQVVLEQQRRQEWRQARMASLEADNRQQDPPPPPPVGSNSSKSPALNDNHRTRTNSMERTTRPDANFSILFRKAFLYTSLSSILLHFQYLLNTRFCAKFSPFYINQKS
uniref:PDZ domain-containing protein n=1 Tax=Globodera rostochiensis TaxID=31243 RepID=A0A914HPY6_GLORO